MDRTVKTRGTRSIPLIANIIARLDDIEVYLGRKEPKTGNNCRIFKFKGTYGVCWPGTLVYEAGESGFCKETAQRIADLENSDNPPRGWAETRQMLEAEGFKL